MKDVEKTNEELRTKVFTLEQANNVINQQLEATKSWLRASQQRFEDKLKAYQVNVEAGISDKLNDCVKELNEVRQATVERVKAEDS